MKTKRGEWIFVVIAIIIQNIYFEFIGNYKEQLIFCYGLGRSIPKQRYLDVCALLLPVFFILLNFSGMYHEILEGYGKFLLIRRFSKNRLIAKVIGKIGYQVCIITAIQILFAILFGDKFYLHSVYENTTYVTGYLLVLISLVILQFLIEYFMEAQYANIIMEIYIVVATLLSTILNDKKLGFIIYPVKMFGGISGIADKGIYALLGMGLAWMALIVAEIGFIIFKFKKKDIY